VSRVLLLSGGMDSTAIAHWLEPEALLFVDYGQKPSAAEHRAADRVAIQVQRPLACLSVDCAPVGEDLLRGPDAPTKPTGEVWWPYRNQLLATFASAWALGNGCSEVLIGTVAGDGSVHRDGTTWFVQSLDALISGQEGGVHISAPAIELTTEALIETSGITRDVLAGSYSCHRSSFPCGECGGCTKRDQILGSLRVRTR
jgi:7-cyano-7-deazaguanine synthase